MTRHICYVSGTRADFGLMRSTLVALDAHPALSVEVLVTGTHLSADFGMTVSEIHEAGLRVGAEIPLSLSPATGATMARNIGRMVTGFVDHLERIEPEVLLLLGDRGEMLAAAIAGIHLNIPIGHVHGGERSGTVDEPVRHAISKLSHLHFVATKGARERLIRMGERQENIWVTGAPGLDELACLPLDDRAALCNSAGLLAGSPLALLVFHPVLQEAEEAGGSAGLIIGALLDQGIQVVALMPNSDAGSDAIRDVLLGFTDHPSVRLFTHLPRREFVSWMACCDVMIGNSSAGIIEAATFGTPVINLGSRQNLRERNSNTWDAPLSGEALLQAVSKALRGGRLPARNVYGDGQAGSRIASVLSTHALDRALLSKANAY